MRKGGVYLAGPIDDVSSEEAAGWRQEAADRLREIGFCAFSPAHAFFTSGPALMDNARYIDSVNRSAIEMADAVLVYLAGEGRAIGTIREIERAVSRGVPTVVVVPQGGPPRVALHDVVVTHTIKDACSEIVKIWEERSKWGAGSCGTTPVNRPYR